MTDPQTRRNPVEELAEAFLQRYRRGERPSLSEYTGAHPELADEIRDLFPALVMMEEAGLRAAERLGPYDGRVTADGQDLRRLGDYHILRQVGRGGMGVVYEAEQESLGRHVALKVLPFESAADHTRLERFRREARALARLHHTNIVPVFDVGVQEGIHYYAMQFIQGQSLDDVVAEVKQLRAGKKAEARETGPRLASDLASGLLTGQFKAEPSAEANEGASQPGDVAAAGGSNVSTSDVLKTQSDFSTQSDFHYYRSVARVGLQVAEALAYAHGQKVLHRDIKPSNLLLDLQGTVWVTDFGLAKDESEDLTRTGDVVGTLRYMAPERFKGISDQRSDIYSLGLTLYELLTLRSAFQESDRARLIWRVSHEEPRPPRKLDRRLPRDLETIVLKAIAKEPKGRYQTAEALAEDLRRFLADRPIQARRSSWAEQAWRWCRRNPGWAAMIGSVAGLLLVIGIGLSMGMVRLQTALDRAESAERTTQEKLYSALVQQALATSRSRRPGQRFESLAKVAEATRLARERGWLPDKALELRNTALTALIMPDLYPGRSWPCPGIGETWVDFDESFTLYARTGPQGSCSIRRVADDAEVHCLTGLVPPSGGRVPPFPMLTGDGRFVAVWYAYGPAKVWQLDGQEPKVLLTEKDVWSAVYHPDSSQVAFAHRDGAISLYSLATGRQVNRLSRDLSPNAPWRELVLALHPTQPWIAVGSYFQTEMQIRNLQSGKVEHRLDRPLRASHVAWHPKGHLLAVSDADAGGIHLYDTATFRCVRTLSGVLGGTRVHFNHAGNRLMAAGWDGPLLLFDIATGQLLFQHPVTARTVHLRFHRDDDWLAGGVGQGRLSLWQVGDGREYRTLAPASPPNEPVYRALAVHPRSRLLAVTVYPGLNQFPGISFWDLNTGEHLAFLPQVGVWDLCFEPSDSLLTVGWFGSFRWPVRGDDEQITIGPPTRLPLPPQGGLSRSRDGRVLVSSVRATGYWQPYAGGWIMHTDRPASPQRLDPMTDITTAVVDPEGRWVVTLQHNVGPVKIWDAATGQLIRQFEKWGQPQFSPDGRWLAIGGDPGYFYAVGSWTAGPRFRGWGVFSPDSKLFAATEGDHVLRLVETDSGRELARLEEPNLEVPGSLCFTSDGTRLITTTYGKASGVHVWNLASLRAQLGEMELDWDAAAGPPLSRETVPLRLEILGADGFHAAARALEHLDNDRPEAAAADLEKALAVMPELDWACNQLARLYVLGPKTLRNADKAVELAERAIRLCPNDVTYKSTLGMAYYRAGQWPAARDTLEVSLRDSLGWREAHDLFFLAMCHHRLSDPAKAKDCYDRAVKWVDKRQIGLPGDWAAELRELRGEADALLRPVDPAKP